MPKSVFVSQRNRKNSFHNISYPRWKRSSLSDNELKGGRKNVCIFYRKLAKVIYLTFIKNLQTSPSEFFSALWMKWYYFTVLWCCKWSETIIVVTIMILTAHRSKMYFGSIVILNGESTRLCVITFLWLQLIGPCWMQLWYWISHFQTHVKDIYIYIYIILSISCEIARRWLTQVFTDDKLTLVQVMAWCRQATSHYLRQCWPWSMSPYGVTRPQWIKTINHYIVTFRFLMLKSELTHMGLVVDICIRQLFILTFMWESIFLWNSVLLSTSFISISLTHRN